MALGSIVSPAHELRVFGGFGSRDGYSSSAGLTLGSNDEFTLVDLIIPDLKITIFNFCMSCVDNQ